MYCWVLQHISPNPIFENVQYTRCTFKIQSQCYYFAKLKIHYTLNSKQPNKFVQHIIFLCKNIHIMNVLYSFGNDAKFCDFPLLSAFLSSNIQFIFLRYMVTMICCIRMAIEQLPFVFFIFILPN